MKEYSLVNIKKVFSLINSVNNLADKLAFTHAFFPHAVSHDYFSHAHAQNVHIHVRELFINMHKKILISPYIT